MENSGKSKIRYREWLKISTLLMPLSLWPSVASAQDADAQAQASSGEIVVSARKRDETLLSVPVAVAAVNAEQLSSRGITNLEGVARTIPGLILAEAAGSHQGGALALRGIGATDGNTFGDQAVGFYIDGVMVARSSPRKMSEIDLQQIEVLKGPQALYYGKNSPAGVIVIRTADPGDRFEAGGKIGYEFNAKEIRGEAFVSSPLTDSLGIRVAVGASDMKGWTKNVATPGTIYSPTDRTSPSAKEFNSRLTLKYDDGGPFSARFKFAYGYVKNDGFAANSQLVSCPRGFSQEGPLGADDCRPDDVTVRSNLGTRYATGGVNTVTGALIPPNPYFGDGIPFARHHQYLSGLELSFDVSDDMTFKSTTGFYKINMDSVDDYYNNDPTFPFNPLAGEAGVGGFLGSVVDLDIREISQELRLESSFDGPFNFMIGGYAQKQRVEQINIAAVNAVNPINLFAPARAVQKGEAYSAFASGTFDISDQIELSGGVRYSYEKKRAFYYRLLDGRLPAAQGGAAYLAGDLVPTVRPRRSFDNFSPEVMLTYRPNSNLTLYGGWKRGFLSGGFNAASGGNTVAVLPDRSYDEQTVEGFEGGIKGQFLDGAVRANLAVFSYKIDGLQTSRIDPVSVANDIRNAATARSKGVEFDLTWRTLLDGLSLNGGVAYNRARYLEYNDGPCYGGQRIAEGCNLGFNAARGVYTQQDLSGQPLVRAPEWGVALGANYETEIGNGDKIGLNVAGNYSSKIFTDSANSPGGVQKGYWLLDASARYETAGGIELAIIGRNLTNTYYFQRSADVPLGGTPSGTATSIRPDTTASVSRGREIWVRAGFKF